MLKHVFSRSKSLLQPVSHYKYLRASYHSSVINALPVAVWRLPGERGIQSVVDLSGTCLKININLSEIPPGFVVAPFEWEGDKSPILIRGNLYFKDSRMSDITDPDERNHPQITKNKARYEKTLEKILTDIESGNGEKIPYFSRNRYSGGRQTKGNSSVSKNAYCQWVERAIEQIDAKLFEKVVLSRTDEVEVTNEMDPFHLFTKLCAAYPKAFVSLVTLPGTGTWIGASPELLLSLNSESLSTESLAGTKPVLSATDPTTIQWNNKEFNEQAIVTDFIRGCFLQQNITNFSEQGPNTVRIGNLFHLQTRFRARLPRKPYWSTVNRLLMALHPTPAVCGFPKMEALRFILEHESHDREFYSGFLGPVHVENQSNLFVNLRCMQLKSDTAILYAGAGITKESDPEQEWLETELKLKALRNHLSDEPIETTHITNRVKVSESDGVVMDE